MAETNQTPAKTNAGSGRVDSLRDSAANANEQLARRVEGAPLAALAAGVVVGAVAGALLPRSDRETELLGPIGSRIGQAAAEAARAAREAGKQELGILAEKSPLEMVVEKAASAVSAAGSAASNAAASTVSGKQDA